MLLGGRQFFDWRKSDLEPLGSDYYLTPTHNSNPSIEWIVIYIYSFRKEIRKVAA